MPTHRLDKSTCCPSCGGKNNAAVNWTGKGAPKLGDVSVCWYCGALLEMTVDETWSVARRDHPAQTDPMVLKFRAELIAATSWGAAQ